MMNQHQHNVMTGTISDTQEILYVNNDNYFNDLLRDIDNAEKTVNLETFIFADDILGERVAKHLIAAALRGVKVRLMIDGMGALLWHAKFRKEMEAAGVAIKIFHPAPWRVWQWAYSIHVGHFLLRKLLIFTSKLNFRNHRKVTIIDNQIVWIGSINITKEHLALDKGGDGWCDAALRLKSMDFADLNLAFEAEWTEQHYQMLFGEDISNSHMRLNNTLVRRVKLQRSLYRKILHATQKVWIINAYFVPNSQLMSALQRAAKAGVDVRMILPEKNNHRFMGLVGAMFYEKLIIAGVKVYLYTPSMIHEKSMIIDDWATVGTSNLNFRSLFRDLEVDVVLSTTAARVALEQHFADCLAQSQPVSLEYLRRHSWLHRLIGHMLLLGRYFL